MFNKILKHIALLFAIVFVTWSIVIYYWRDTSYQPSLNDVIFCFLLLPFLIYICFLLPFITRKIIKMRMEKQKINNDKSKMEVEVNEVLDKKDTKIIKLKIYQSDITTKKGKNEALILNAMLEPFCNLDQYLVNNKSLPIATYRMEDLQVEQGDDLNCKEHRIKALIKSQFELYSDHFQKIFQHIHKSHQFYSGNQNYIYKIHPKWIDPENNIQDDDETIEQVVQLDCLNIEIILSDQQNLTEFAQLNSELFQNELNLYDDFQDYITVHYHFWNNQESYAHWLKLLEEIALKTAQTTLVIIADSEIDQAIVNKLLFEQVSHTPTESVASLLIASDHLEVMELLPSHKLIIEKDQTTIQPFLEQLELTNLDQYTDEKPFVMLINETDSQKSKEILVNNFSNSPIKDYHYIYNHQKYGFTQNLSEIWGVILTMQIPDMNHVLAYNTNDPYTQIVCEKIEVNKDGLI